MKGKCKTYTMRQLLSRCFQEVFEVTITEFRCQYDMREENEELILKLKNEFSSVCKGFSGNNVELTAGEAEKYRIFKE